MWGGPSTQCMISDRYLDVAKRIITRDPALAAWLSQLIALLEVFGIPQEIFCDVQCANVLTMDDGIPTGAI